jgi:hypothetical protein
MTLGMLGRQMFFRDSAKLLFCDVDADHDLDKYFIKIHL